MIQPNRKAPCPKDRTNGCGVGDHVRIARRPSIWGLGQVKEYPMTGKASSPEEPITGEFFSALLLDCRATHSRADFEQEKLDRKPDERIDCTPTVYPHKEKRFAQRVGLGACTRLLNRANRYCGDGAEPGKPPPRRGWRLLVGELQPKLYTERDPSLLRKHQTSLISGTRKPGLFSSFKRALASSAWSPT